MHTFTPGFFPFRWLYGSLAWAIRIQEQQKHKPKHNNGNKEKFKWYYLDCQLSEKNRYLLQNSSHLVQSVTLPDWLYHWQQFTLTHCALQCTGNVSTTSCRTSPKKANAWDVLSRKLYTPQKYSQLSSTLLKYLSAFLHFGRSSSIFKII